MSNELDLNEEGAAYLIPTNHSPQGEGEAKEQARLYAESRMMTDWDRDDQYQVISFYNHMVDYLARVVASAHTDGKPEGSRLIGRIVDDFANKKETFIPADQIAAAHAPAEGDEMPESYYQPLFDLMYEEHGLTLLESEMKDIIYVVEKMQEPTSDLIRSIIDKMLNIDKPTYSETELMIIKESIDRHMNK